MKRVVLKIFSLMVLCIVLGCNSKQGKPIEMAATDSSKVEQADDGISDSLKAELERGGIFSIEDLDGAIEGFFTEVYNEIYYEDDGFIEKYCTDKFKKKLREEVDVDTEGEVGYATWLFRSDAQDGPSDEYRITKFVPQGHGWYKYEFIDMGVQGSHRIKFIAHVNPRDQAEFYIDDLE